MTRKTWLQCGLLLVGLGGILACDKTPPPPKTYLVKGKVVFIEGGAPSAGLITFRSSGEAIVANGKIASDGTFSLSMIANNGQRMEGTVEGEHEVTFIPDQAAQGQSNLIPSTAAEKYKVKADGDNDLTIKLARPKPPG